MPKSLDLKRLETPAFPVLSKSRRKAGCYNRKEMEPVRTGLRNIMSDLLRARPAEEAALLAWPLVCGRDVAKRTQATSFSDGCLTVEVSDRRWAAELTNFSKRYISGFDALLGPLVKEVRFKISQGSKSAIST